MKELLKLQEVLRGVVGFLYPVLLALNTLSPTLVCPVSSISDILATTQSENLAYRIDYIFQYQLGYLANSAGGRSKP